MEFKEQKIGAFGVIQKNENGEISQIGLTESQYLLFEMFLSQIGALIRLPPDFNLELNNKPTELSEHIDLFKKQMEAKGYLATVVIEEYRTNVDGATESNR